MPTEIGRCRLCGYEPVAFNAPICPKCGGNDPNPGVAGRYVGRAALGGLFLGILAGTAWGTFDRGTTSAVIGSGVIGAMAGLILGMLGGLVFGSVAWMIGKR